MHLEILGPVLATAIFLLPVVILTPVIERLFEIGQFRAVVRRIFRVDDAATVASLPEVAPQNRSRK